MHTVVRVLLEGCEFVAASLHALQDIVLKATGLVFAGGSSWAERDLVFSLCRAISEFGLLNREGIFLVYI